MKERIKTIKLRNIFNRNAPCHFCGGNRSVKYDAELDNGKVVPCCNKCAFLYYVIGEG